MQRFASWFCAVAIVVGSVACSSRQTPAETLRREPPTLATIRAVGELPDHVGIMTEKTDALIRVVRREPVGSPMRELALGYLAHSNVYLNEPAAREFARAMLHGEQHDREQLLIAPWLSEEHQVGMLAAYIPWISAQIASPDRIVRELVMVRLRAIGRHVKPETDPAIAAHAMVMLDGVLATPNLDRGIRQTAIEARVDLETPHPDHVHVDELPRADRYDLWREVRDGWLPIDPQADATFDRIAAPLLEQPIHYTENTFAAIHGAFAVRGVTPAKRAHLIARLLALHEGDVTPFDASHLASATVIPQGPYDLITFGAWELERDPDLVDADPALRAVVAALAAQPFDPTGNIDRDQPLMILQPAFVRVVRAMDRAAAAPILAGWQRSVRALAARTDGHTYYATYASVGYLLGLAELATKFGIVDEVKALATEIARSPLPSDDNRLLHPMLTRGATIAGRLLAP